MSEAAYALPQTVVFIDASLPDLATLRAGLPAEATVHLLDPAQDGLQQMAGALAGQFDVPALHLITHGAPGQLQLGHASIGLAELKTDRQAITTIAAAMAEDGEWLIYGCQVAAGREGRAFINALTSMTGLKVAAATHKVGHAAMGGSWALDVLPVTMTTPALAVPVWQGVLPAELVADIRGGASGSTPQNFAVFNGALYFAATDGSTGLELWKYDGTNAPSRVADINSSPTIGSNPRSLTVYNGALYFQANDGLKGAELWTYTGSGSPTRVTDINPNAFDSSPASLTVFRDNPVSDVLYFAATNTSNPTNIELWKYDSASGNATLAADILTGDTAGSSPAGLIVYNGELYFSANNGTNGIELWKFNGSTASLVANINSGNGNASSNPTNFTGFNNELYFQADDGINGTELWKYDGTNASLVADIWSGGDVANPNSSTPRNLTVFKNALYFTAYNDTAGFELWQYDGTNSPSLVADIATDIDDSSPAYLTVLNDVLYFSAFTTTNSRELWKYDGINAPVLAADIRPGANGSIPQNLTAFNGALYFSANDGTTGNELWKYTDADTTPPSFVSAATNSDGTKVILTYNEALNATTAAVNTFQVLVGSTENAVTAVTVSGSTVELTLTTAISYGQQATVAYTAPASVSDTSNSAVQDAVGNDAVTLAATSVTNNTPENIPPQFQSAATSADGTKVILTYNEALSATTAAAGDFIVTTGGNANAVTAVAVSGSTVELTLTTAVAFGQAVTVAYTDPSASNDANAVQDLVGNDAATRTATTVTNNVPDTTAPVFQSAATNANGTKVILTYDEALSATTAAAGDFTVSTGGNANTVTAVAVSGSTVELTLTTAVTSGQAVTVAYTDPSTSNDANAVQDAAGNDAATLAATTVTSNVPDTTAPVFQSAATSTDGSKVILTYNEALNATTAATGAFAVFIGTLPNRTLNYVTGVAVNGSTVELTLTTPITFGQIATVYYNSPASDSANTNLAVQDTAGNDATSLSSGSVTNNVPDTLPPVFQSAATSSDGSKVILTYNEALSATTAAAGDFAVIAGGNANAVTAVTVSGSTVELTLTSAVTFGQAVTVAYTDPSTSNDVNAVQDALGNDAITLAARSVTNNTPDTLPPVFQSAATNTNGTKVILTYDEALSATTAAAGDFIVTTGGNANTVTAVAVSGSTVELTLTNAVAFGQAATVAYTDPSTNNDVNAVQDALGNDAATLTETTVTNNVPDAPSFLSATVSNDGKLILTYNEPLSATTAAVGAFNVTTGVSDPNAVTAVAVNGSTVELTLTTPIVGGDIVNVAYTAPTPDNTSTNNAVQDSTGNDAATLPRTRVSNTLVDTTPPVFDSAATDGTGTKVFINYKETLSTTTAAASAFTVKVGGTPNVVTAVAAGSVAPGGSVSAVLTLATPVGLGQTVTVAYTAPASDNANTNNAVQDIAGYDAASLPDTPVTNRKDETPPEVQFADTSMDGTKIILHFNEDMSTVTAPASMFRVTTGGMPNAVTAISVAYSNIELTLTTPVTYGQSVSVLYNDLSPSNDTNVVQDQSGNDIALIYAPNVTNAVLETTPPVFQSAATSTDGTKVILTYNEALSATTAAVGAFNVTTGGNANAVTAVTVNGSTVVLTLTTAVTNGQAITVAYTDPSTNNDANAVQDAVGNDAATRVATTVTNSVAAPAPAPDPGPTPTPAPAPAPGPSTPADNDGVSDAVESAVPSLPSVAGSTLVTGDGNGDGLADAAQKAVVSTPFRDTSSITSNPNAPSTFVTLVADSQDGKANTSTANITSIVQKDAPAVLPEGMKAPLGLIGFTASIAQAGSNETFSLFVDAKLGVNGYWKQDSGGTWVNLASAAYGGGMVEEGGKLRLDFQIVDGGQFDADGVANGSIADPGAAGFMAQSITEYHPKAPTVDHFWF